MKRAAETALVIAVLLCAGVADAARRRPVHLPSGPPVEVRVEDDFRLGTLGWEAAFADYSPENDANGLMELLAELRPLPPELGIIGTGYFFRGHNRSDDLFMFMTKRLTQVDGIRPNQAYHLTFEVVLASNAGRECGGIGGAPGQSVYLKVGAAGEPPLVVTDESGHYRVSVDKGNQAMGGEAASVAGDISIDSANCSSDSPFQSIQRSHAHPHIVSSNAAGDLWLIVGTDSGFEGLTRIFYQSVRVLITPVAEVAGEWRGDSLDSGK